MEYLLSLTGREQTILFGLLSIAIILLALLLAWKETKRELLPGDEEEEDYFPEDELSYGEQRATRQCKFEDEDE